MKLTKQQQSIAIRSKFKNMYPLGLKEPTKGWLVAEYTESQILEFLELQEKQSFIEKKFKVNNKEDKRISEIKKPINNKDFYYSEMWIYLKRIVHLI